MHHAAMAPGASQRYWMRLKDSRKGFSWPVFPHPKLYVLVKYIISEVEPMVMTASVTNYNVANRNLIGRADLDRGRTRNTYAHCENVHPQSTCTHKHI